ncbi:hypothetical protein ACIPT2_12650 [Pectobacterium brasiliense]|uniref:hypothetical protein n=1 Tax=Pectobacterium brasiliense TaxID=180957 RepID=UPI0038035E03
MLAAAAAGDIVELLEMPIGMRICSIDVVSEALGAGVTMEVKSGTDTLVAAASHADAIAKSVPMPPGFADVILIWNPINHSDFYGCLLAVNFTNAMATVASVAVANGVWDSSWSVGWNSRNLSPVDTGSTQAIRALKVFIRDNATSIIQAATLGGASYFEGQDEDGSTRWYLGYPNSNDKSLLINNVKAGGALNLNQNGTLYITAQNIVFQQDKGFMRNAKSQEFTGGQQWGGLP